MTDPLAVCCAPQLLSVQGSWHLGQVQVGLSQARRLCRCSHARITLSQPTPMQVPCSAIVVYLLQSIAKL